MRQVWIIGILFLFGFVQVTHAQYVSKDLQLNEVEVTAKRPLKSTGIEKTLIDTLLLHENIALSMADILQLNSTLFIKSYGRATESTAEFRGTSPSHTQVTWNGMKINSPLLGTVDFSTIPSYFIDEANLYHGASSIQLSGGGLGGAVELSSKNTTQPGFYHQSIWGLGSYGTVDRFHHFSYNKGRLKWQLRWVRSKANNDYSYVNYDKKTDVRDEQGNIIDSYHPTEKNKSGYFRDMHLMQDLSFDAGHGHTLTSSIWVARTRRGLPFLSVDYRDDTEFKNEQNHHTVRGVLGWDWNNSTVKTSVKAGYAYNDVDYMHSTTRGENTQIITASQSYTNTAFSQLKAEYIPNEKWMLSTEFTDYYHHVKSQDRSPFHMCDNYNIGRNEFTASTSLRYRPVELVSLAAVLREEAYENDWLPLIPAIFGEVVVYKPLNLVWKASIARNYRYPTLDDLYFQPGGNPNLGPEKGFTWDTGLEFQLIRKRGNLKGNLQFFDSHINDWILWTPNVKGFWEPTNVKKVHNYGVELNLTGMLRFNKDWNAEMNTNLAWTPSKNVGERVNDNDQSYGKQLCYIPKLSAGMNLRLHYRDWTLNYKFAHYSERYTTTSNEVDRITGRLEPYYMHDASMEKLVRTKVCDVNLKVQVNNLLNCKYVTVLSRPMPGTNFEVFFEIRPKYKKFNGK